MRKDKEREGERGKSAREEDEQAKDGWMRKKLKGKREMKPLDMQTGNRKIELLAKYNLLCIMSPLAFRNCLLSLGGGESLALERCKEKCKPRAGQK